MSPFASRAAALARWTRLDGAPRPGIHWLSFTLLLVLGTLLAIGGSRGRMGPTYLSYNYAHEALIIASGRLADVPTDYAVSPPGYSLLMVPLIWLGLTPLRAGWLIAAIGFGATIALTVEIGRRLISPLAGIVAAVVIAFNGQMVERANTQMAETIFTAAMLAAILTFDLFYVRWAGEGVPPGQGGAFLLGLALAAPFWLRYIGVIVPMVGFTGLLMMWLSRPRGRAGLLAAAAGWACIFLAPVPIYNRLASGGVFGHPVGALPADTFGSAMTGAMHSFRVLFFYFAERFPRPLTDAATGALILGAAILEARRFRMLFLSLTPITYLLVLCFIASHNRIDKMNYRFLLPILPVLVLLIYAGLRSAISMVPRPDLRAPRAVGWGAVALAIALAAVAGLSVSRGLQSVVGGFEPDSTYSPLTVAYVVQNIPAGSTLAVNSRQSWAHTLAHREVILPWQEPGDHTWPEAYGIHTWSRVEALRAFLDKDVTYVVLFKGGSGDDRYLMRAYPGEYVAKTLVTQPLPEVASVRHLPDGVVVVLADRARLRDALAEAEAKTTR